MWIFCPDVQDGAPPHWGLIVCVFLDEIFSNRWIERNDPTLWPPCSPDITPLEFFYGATSKTEYTPRLSLTDEPKTRIHAAVGAVM